MRWRRRAGAEIDPQEHGQKHRCSAVVELFCRVTLLCCQIAIHNHLDQLVGAHERTINPGWQAAPACFCVRTLKHLFLGNLASSMLRSLFRESFSEGLLKIRGGGSVHETPLAALNLYLEAHILHKTSCQNIFADVELFQMPLCRAKQCQGYRKVGMHCCIIYLQWAANREG